MVSIKSSSSDPPTMASKSSQPPSIYQPSVYSSCSYPYPAYNSRNESCERLLQAKKPVLPKSNLRYSGPRTTTRQIVGPAQRKRMASNGIPIVEQKKSYGIGGAGNIRTSLCLLLGFAKREIWGSFGTGADECNRSAFRGHLPTADERRW